MGVFTPSHTVTMHSVLRHLRSTALWLALGCALSAPVWADDRSDHNQARAAMESGQVLPLKTVLDQLERQRPGKVLEVELERKGGGWVYEIKQLESRWAADTHQARRPYRTDHQHQTWQGGAA
jgi:hypothetical protein